MTTTALRIGGATKTYGRVTALDGLDLEVAEGRFFVIFGPSAVGKTTTLRTIAGLVRPDRGRVEIFGKDVTQAPIAGRGVSMVFQTFALYPHLTVYDNLAYPLREARVPSAEIARRVNEIAELLRISHVLKRKPVDGERRRAAARRARALAHPAAARSCFSTSRSPISTPSSGTTCAPSSSACTASSASPSSTPRPTSSRRFRWATRSR